MNARALGCVIALLAGGAGCTTAVEARAGFVAPVDVLQVRWRQHLTSTVEQYIEYKPQEFAAAAAEDGRVFVGSSTGKIFAFAARDGGVLWDHVLEGGIAARPRYVRSEGAIYVGTRLGHLYALDAESGKVRWEYTIKGPIESEPTFADGIVYFTSGENRVYAVDAQKGTWKWQYEREPPESFTIRGYAAPLVVGSRVYVGFSDGYLACLAASTGDVLWARSLAGDATRFMDVDSTPIIVDGVLYVSSYAGGVYALDPKDGSVKWRFEVEGAGTVRVQAERVYFSAAKAGLYCLDLDGHKQWRQSLADGGELSTPLLVNGYVLVSSASGGTYVADAASGRLYQYFAPGHGVTSEPVTDGRQIYLLTNNGFFYALGFQRG